MLRTPTLTRLSSFAGIHSHNPATCLTSPPVRGFVLCQFSYTAIPLRIPLPVWFQVRVGSERNCCEIWKVEMNHQWNLCMVPVLLTLVHRAQATSSTRASKSSSPMNLGTGVFLWVPVSLMNSNLSLLSSTWHLTSFPTASTADKWRFQAVHQMHREWPWIDSLSLYTMV